VGDDQDAADAGSNVIVAGRATFTAKDPQSVITGRRWRRLRVRGNSSMRQAHRFEWEWTMQRVILLRVSSPSLPAEV
jgi:hypothetical protein